MKKIPLLCLIYLALLSSLLVWLFLIEYFLYQELNATVEYIGAGVIGSLFCIIFLKHFGVENEKQSKN